MNDHNSTSAAEPYGRAQFEARMRSLNTCANLARYTARPDEYRTKTVDNAWKLWRSAYLQGVNVDKASSDVKRRLAYKHGHDDGVKSMAVQLADLTRERDAWKEMLWAVARELNCLPSTFSDGNAHVLKAAIKLNALKATQAPTVPSSDWQAGYDAAIAGAARLGWKTHGIGAAAKKEGQ